MTTAIDTAWHDLEEAAENLQAKESVFYELFLNSELFFVTDKDPSETEEGSRVTEETEEFNMPMVEADGKLYIMLFDSKERLADWADREVSVVGMQGAAILEGLELGENAHIMLNQGTEHWKEFIPDEIAWLKSNIQEKA